jgi:hypothetical protein
VLKKPVVLVKGFIDEFKPVTGENVKLKTKQFKEIMQLILRCQFKPSEYYLYYFHEIDKDYKYMLNYISKYNRTCYYCPSMNNMNWAHVFTNKLFFKVFFKNMGFPVTKTYGYYDCEAGFFENGNSLTSPKELKDLIVAENINSLVIKPVGLSQGRDVLIIPEVKLLNESAEFRTVGGKNYSINELTAHMQKKITGSPYSGFLLEEKVIQHELIDSINPDSLNTIRLITLLNKEHEAVIPFAVLRIGRAGSGIDSTAQGGLYARINLSDGVLGKGIFSRKYGVGLQEVHPDTKVKFTGMKVPYWEEVMKICSSAARVSPFCRSIGWDVGITPDGPVLIEGNHDHSVELQALYNGFLQPDVRKILSELGIEFPKDKLPPIDFVKLFKALRMWSNKKI